MNCQICGSEDEFGKTIKIEYRTDGELWERHELFMCCQCCTKIANNGVIVIPKPLETLAVEI